eukprot:CAMPEP_0197852696 /NCGR_PEP_ID=MMETSP1438-20131217/21227_1 /TAXON_ID=1461541 /ORGANISM="Pterosperma sp., Strain CCMP1384" /LENGTH=396 /DNA_ID=CAMNT_0043466857 /DNA_START=15 /DNA_END=1205 /DNA_ORIENTATION=-
MKAALEDQHQGKVVLLEQEVTVARERASSLERELAAVEETVGAEKEARAALEQRIELAKDAERKAQTEAEKLQEAAQEEIRSERRNSQVIQEKAEKYAKEVNDARRIQDLHNASEQKQMNEDLTTARAELDALKQELESKKRECKTMRRQMTDLSVFADDEPKPSTPTPLMLSGEPVLGQTLRVSGGNTTNCVAQWHRVSSDGNTDIIAGATRVQYAPEPRDVGYLLGCNVSSPGGKPQMATTEKFIEMSPGLTDYVNTLMARGGGEFNVVIVQLNGAMQDRRSVYQLEVLSSKLKIKRNGRTKYKENYHPRMQVCGARGGGDAAAQGLFLALTPSLVFMLASESSRERNAAIMLIRKFSQQNGIFLKGPESSSPSATTAASKTTGGEEKEPLPDQ